MNISLLNRAGKGPPALRPGPRECPRASSHSTLTLDLLCAHARAHTHSSFYGKFYCPCFSLSFPLLLLLSTCDLCFLAFQEVLRISSSILACLVPIPPSLYNVLVMICQPPPPSWLWAGSGEAPTAHWCRRVCPGYHSQEMVPVCLLSLSPFSYITPRPQGRTASPFTIADI